MKTTNNDLANLRLTGHLSSLISLPFDYLINSNGQVDQVARVIYLLAILIVLSGWAYNWRKLDFSLSDHRGIIFGQGFLLILIVYLFYRTL